MYGLVLYPYYLKEKIKKAGTNYDYEKFLIDNNFYSIYSTYYSSYRQNNIAFLDWGKKPLEVFDIKPELLVNKFGNGIQKTINLIFAARKINIILLSLAVVTTYLIYLKLSNVFIASFGAVIYGFNYFIITSGLRAQSEGLFLTLFNIALLFLILFLCGTKKYFYLALIFSFVTALLTQTKLNGIMLLFCFDLLFVSKIIYFFITGDKNIKIFRLVSLFLMVNILTVFFFISLHPFLYKNPVGNTIFMYQHRMREAIKQSQELPSPQMPPSLLPSFTSRIAAIYQFSFNVGLMNFLNLNSRTRLNFQKMSVIFFVLGFIYIFFRIWKQKKIFHPLSFFILSFIMIQLITANYLILNIDRYFIYFIIFFNFIIVVGLIFLVKVFYYLFKSLYQSFFYP